MRVKEVFKARHDLARKIFYNDVLDSWAEEQLRKPVLPAMNSLAWVLWHVARAEDAGVLRFVAREPQVFHKGNWKRKLNIDVEYVGYGMSVEAARKLSDNINLDALKIYWHTVTEKTYAVVDALTEAQMDEVLSETEVKQVVAEGIVPEHMDVDDVPYVGWTRLEALYHFSMTHYYWHGGEVQAIESLLRAKQAAAE